MPTLGHLLLLTGVAMVMFAIVRLSVTAPGAGDGRAAAARAAAELDDAVTAARDRVRVAQDLARRDIVRGVIVTDAASATDALGTGELAFPLRPGEVLEIGQLAGTSVVPLFVAPHAAPAGKRPEPRRDLAGTHTQVLDRTLWLTEVAAVTPQPMRSGDGEATPYVRDGVPVTGYVMLSHAVALDPTLERLAARGLAGHLELDHRHYAFGAASPEAPTASQQIAGLSGARLVVASPAPGVQYARPLLVAGFGLVGLGAAFVLVGLAAGSRPAPSPVVPRSRPHTPTSPRSPPGSSLAKRLGRTVGATPSMLQLAQPRVSANGTPFEPADTPGHTAVGSGTLIGRWQVMRKLGSGGMSDVYLAHARREGGFEKPVAIKILNARLADSPSAVAHFLDEARLAARIAHQNVVAIHDLGKIDGEYVIVMDYVDGVDLEQLLLTAQQTSRAIPIEIALGIACRICDGLHAAHNATGPDGTPLGIIHRDIKTANVLISKQGAVKIVDFGIAKASQQIHMTMSGEIKGTPASMAPEQRIGEVVDIRADVYSVAVVAYELLTGRPVNLDLFALAHLGTENWPHLPPPSTLRPELPVDLDEILFGAMAFDRRARPTDCATFEAALSRVMKAHALSASDKDIARWLEGEQRGSPRLHPPTSSFDARPDDRS